MFYYTVLNQKFYIEAISKNILTWVKQPGIFSVQSCCDILGYISFNPIFPENLQYLKKYHMRQILW